MINNNNKAEIYYLDLDDISEEIEPENVPEDSIICVVNMDS